MSDDAYKYVVDITKPPLGPPMRLGNAFYMLFKINEERNKKYNEYIEEYRKQLKEKQLNEIHN